MPDNRLNGAAAAEVFSCVLMQYAG
jgi:hypothetical protein